MERLQQKRRGGGDHAARVFDIDNMAFTPLEVCSQASHSQAGRSQRKEVGSCRWGVKHQPAYDQTPKSMIASHPQSEGGGGQAARVFAAG
jgi:hypothetical protein